MQKTDELGPGHKVVQVRPHVGLKRGEEKGLIDFQEGGIGCITEGERLCVAWSKVTWDAQRPTHEGTSSHPCVTQAKGWVGKEQFRGKLVDKGSFGDGSWSSWDHRYGQTVKSKGKATISAINSGGTCDPGSRETREKDHVKYWRAVQRTDSHEEQY